MEKTIVANIIAKEDKIDFVKTELEKLIPPTRAEKGCIQYDLHQNNKNPAHFLFYENWESSNLLQEHINSKHFKDFVSNTENALQKLAVDEMTVIG